MENNKIKELIFSMLIENTGTALCDSGGYPQYDENGKYIGSYQGYGRNYERNKGKTLEAFNNEPEVSFSKDWGYTISLFHFLTKQLELDDLCREFNQIECKDFEGKGYGISKLQEELEFETELTETTNLKDLDEWDSMGAMVLIGFVSEEFGVTLNADDIKAMTTINSLIEKIGLENVEWLEANRRTVKKWSRSELLEIIEKYKP
jgi:acyl carrier protein